jgi:hypothetical protein
MNSPPGGGVAGGVLGGVGVGAAVDGNVGGSPDSGGMGNGEPFARVSLILFKIGYAPFPQRFLKSSVSRDQIIPPANPLAIAYLTFHNKFD